MTRGSADRPFAFIDSSAYFAVVDSTDHNHETALAISQQLRRARWRLFTSTYVIAETHVLLLARLNRRIAAQYLDQMEQTSVRIVVVNAADLRRAHAIIRQYDDKDFSLTDATSFAVMERLGIRYAFTFDRDFSQFGLTPLTVQLVCACVPVRLERLLLPGGSFPIPLPYRVRKGGKDWAASPDPDPYSRQIGTGMRRWPCSNS